MGSSGLDDLVRRSDFVRLRARLPLCPPHHDSSPTQLALEIPECPPVRRSGGEHAAQATMTVDNAVVSALPPLDPVAIPLNLPNEPAGVLMQDRPPASDRWSLTKTVMRSKSGGNGPAVMRPAVAPRAAVGATRRSRGVAGKSRVGKAKTASGTPASARGSPQRGQAA